MSKYNQEKSIAGLSALQMALAGKKGKQQNYPPLHEPIAVVGMSCRFPGDSNNPEAYWQLLMNKRSGIVPTPEERWSSQEYVSEQRDKSGTMYMQHGGFIRCEGQYIPEYFDNEFFNISLRECASIDPQHRLLLETAWEAFENAGMVPSELKNSQTGVFVGIFGQDYMLKQMSQDKEQIDAYMGIGAFHSVAAGRVSYFFGFQGPSIATDAACASSLVSIHQACQSLRIGECNMALAAGSHQILAPEFSISFCKAHMLAVDGSCRAFDDEASGFVRGEGCAVVVLKRLSDAISDGDNILALVRGSAVNQDGATSSLTVPNGPAQQRVIQQALANSGIAAKDVAYVETHGTGTPIGDPIEFGALNGIYGAARTGQDSLYIGSVKTNIGHLEGAAGIAGFIKVVLSVQRGKIPPQLNFNQPNKHIDWHNSPIKVVCNTIEWPDSYDTRIAAVSSFGLSGTNAHVLLEQMPDLSYLRNKVQASRGKPESPYLFALSAKSSNSLKQLVSRYINYIELHPQVEVADFCYLVNTGREQFQYRLCIEVESLSELLTKLKQTSLQDWPETKPAPEIIFDITGSTVEALSAKINHLIQADIIPHKLLTDDIPGASAFCVGELKLPNIDIVQQPEFDCEVVVLTLAEWSNNSLLKKAFEAGIKIRWQVLGGCRNFNLPSLPNYAFYRRKHWYRKNSAILEIGEDSRSFKNSVLDHPLLDSRSKKGNWIHYHKVFSGEEWIFSEHKIMGEKILPGMACIEMAFTAVRQELETHEVTALTDINWHSTLRSQNQVVNLVVSFNPSELDNNKSFLIELLDISRDGQETLIMSARVIMDNLKQVVKQRKLNIEELHCAGGKYMDQSEILKRFSSLGLVYQGSFSSLQSVSCFSTYVLGEFNLPHSENFPTYNLHPGLLDSALQSLIGFQFNDGLPGHDSPQILLPVSIGKITLYHPLTNKGFAYGNKVETVSQEQGDSSYDFLITDENGLVLACVENLTVKQFTRERLIEFFTIHQQKNDKNNLSIEINDDIKYLKRQWRQEALIDKNSSQNLRWDPIVLFVSRESYGQGLQSVLPEHEIFVVLLDNIQHLKACAETFLTSNTGQFSAIFCVDFIGDCQEIFYALVDLFRIQATANTGKVKRLCYIDNSGNPINTALAGLFKSLHKEDFYCAWQYINVAHLQVREDILMEYAARELVQPSFHFSVYFNKQGKRFVEGFAPTELLSMGKSPIVDQSVVLISGGAGGIGLVLAEHLVKRYKAKVILAGRSPVSSELLSKLDELKRGNDGELEYQSCDITNLSAVNLLCEKIRHKFGRIDLVIHSAVVTHDGLLLGKDKRALKAVVRTKCVGVQNLDEATQNDKLSLFVSFSSLASVMGNEGQCDYSFANAYLDAFTHRRNTLLELGQRSGKSLSINWPGWDLGEKVGLNVNDDIAEKLYRETGIGHLSASEGLMVFEHSLNQFTDHQVIILKGHWRRFLDHVNLACTVPHIDTDIQVLSSQEKQNLKNYVCSVFAKVLCVEQEQLDVDQSWDVYHMDSIMMLDVTRKLETVFGQLPKTLLFEYKRIGDLVNYLFDTYSDLVLNHFSSEEQTGKISGAKQIQSQIKQRTPEFTGKNHEINNEEIAIIGISGRYPDAEDLDTFWQNLASGKDSITEIPTTRWSHQDYYSEDKDAIGKTYAKWGGFIDGYDEFDPLFFNISPKEALLMDPQERLWMQTAWATIEDAGYTREKLHKQLDAEVGVFVGVMWSEYQLHGILSPRQMGQSLSSSHASIANRVSYWLDVHGPSLAVDTMCSSSLVAIHLACESIRRRECRAALVGGVNLCLHPNKYVQMAQGRFASTDGRCRSFGAGGDGYVAGEGVGAAMLKPLDAAIECGDYIYASILGSSIGHGGKTHGFTIPSPTAQARVIKNALANINIPVDDIAYVEAHGTGTSLGDPIEIKGLCDGYSARTSNKPLYLGSLKSNIGHLEAAAGIASLTKVLLQFKHRKIAPSLHSETINTAIDFGKSVLTVNQQLRTWPAANPGMVAGISAFGAGGANAHIVVHAYSGSNERLLETSIQDKPFLIPVSAMTEKQLQQKLDMLVAFISRHLDDNEISLRRIAYTLQFGREAMPIRRVFAAHDKRQLLHLLQQSELGSLPDKALEWQSGASLDWAEEWLEMRELGAIKQPVMLPLPSYPFAKESYFVRFDKVSNASSEGLLIHQNISTLNEQAFCSEFSGNEYFFREHKIGTENIMPGAVAITMAIQAAIKSVSKPSKAIGVEQVYFHRPVKAGVNGCRVVVSLIPKASKIAFEIYQIAASDSDDRSLCVNGLVVFDKIFSTKNSLELELIKSSLSLEEENYYTQCSARGIEYGSSFRLNEKIWKGESNVLSRLVEGSKREEPALLDSALHIMGVLLSRSNALQIPHTIRSIQYIGDISNTRYVYGEQTQQGQFDIQLVDKQGNVLVFLEGLSCAAPIRASELSSVSPGTKTFTSQELEKAAMGFIRDQLGSLLKLDPSRIDPYTGWDKYGVDSVLVLTITEHFEKRFGELPKSLLFEYENLAHLVGYFISHHRSVLVELLGLDKADSQQSVQSVIKTKKIPQRSLKRFGGEMDIAIVGLSGRYGQASDINTFWENLCKGADCIEEIPSDRWDGKKYYRANGEPGYSSSIWGGFVADVDKFDPLFFGISPTEAQIMDPQERLFLEVAHEAMNDGGYSEQSLREQGEVGVFVGVMYQEYQLYGAQNTVLGRTTSLSGSSASIANRVSYCFNFNGPSMAIDTMCSSSSTALQVACQSIREGRCRSAFAGGVNLSIHPNKYLLLSGSHFLASDGRCRSFGEGGDGYVPGEGVGCVLLKDINDAIQCNDQIYGVIKAIEVNHGGKTNGYTVPSPNAQYDVISRALESAALDASDLSYIETHGTGTPLGDPIEIAALNKIFVDGGVKDVSCAIGSVKSNIGHCESASGIAGLTKTLLQMKHKTLVPSLHSQVLNKNINFETTPFEVVQEVRDWSHQDGKPLIALVSSFGAGGSNSCIILSEFETQTETDAQLGTQLIPLSARTKDQLKQLAERLLESIVGNHLTADRTNSAENLAKPKYVQDILLGFVAELLNVSEADIDPQMPVEEYGLDRTQRLLIHQRICQALEAQISSHRFVQSFSVSAMADSIEQILGQNDFIGNNGEDKIEADNLASRGSVPKLSDIAFTLQLGRQDLKHRIAFLVNSTDALLHALEQWLDKNHCSSEYYFSADHGQSKDMLSLFDAEDLTTVVHKWFVDGELSKVAKLWVSGQSIPWQQLHNQHSNAKRISLATYPFERRRIWYHEQNGFEVPPVSAFATHTVSTEVERLSPLVETNLSTLYRQRYRSRFHVNHYLFADHRLQNMPIFPAAGFIEISAQALKLAGVQAKCAKNIIIMAPNILNEGSTAIVTDLEPDVNDTQCIRFTTKGEDKGGNADERVPVYCQGRWFLKSDPADLPSTIDVQLIKRESTGVAGEKFYRKFIERGFSYGEAFRTIGKAYISGDAALVELQLPQSLSNDFAEYILHPSLIDGAFQSTMALFYQDERDSSIVNKQFIPFSIVQLEVFSLLETHMYAYVSNRKWINKQSGMLSFDVCLVNLQGQVLCAIQGFTLRASSQDLVAPLQPEPLKAVPLKAVPLKAIKAVKDTVKASDTKIDYAIPVWLASSISSQSRQFNWDRVEIALTNEYLQWLEPLRRACPKFRFTLLPPVNTHEEVGTEVFQVFMAMFEQIRVALLDKASLLNFAVIVPGDVPAYRMLNGLLLSANQEQPKLSAKLIELSGVGEFEGPLQNSILQELSVAPEGVEHIRLRRETVDQVIREKKQWQICSNELAVKTASPIPLCRKGGVYWITGGLGGIGQAIVEEMSSTSDVKIVLTGRSEADDKIENKLEVLRKSSKARIVYYACDAADRTQVSQTYQNITENLGPLCGIIHSAGVINDGLITRKLKDGIPKVFEAKIEGAIELDRVSKHAEQLEYFMLFSSLASVNGNIGQSDYASANAYLDGFALRRQEQVLRGERSGLSISINWPLWRDGGMQLSPSMERWMLNKTGLVPISNSEGMSVLHRVLNLQQPLVAAFRQHGNKSLQFLNIKPAEISADLPLTTDTTLTSDPSLTTDTLLTTTGGIKEFKVGSTRNTQADGYTQAELKQTTISLLAEVLKVDESDVDSDVDLIEYGVDSIQMIALLNRFEQEFGKAMDPNAFVHYTTVNALVNYFIKLGLNNHSSEPLRPQEEHIAELMELSETTKTNSAQPLRAFIDQQGEAHQNSRQRRGSSNGKVAVIACSAKFPGAGSVEAFWHHLAKGTDLMSEIPVSRWDIRAHYDPNRQDSAKSYAKRGGFIQGIDQFDAEYFAISQDDAMVMDPQQRIILMQTQHLFDAAGYSADELRGSNTGVFLGAKENNYLKKYQSLIPEQTRKSLLVYSLANMIAGRIADHYDLRGVAKTIDTACSSSLVAVHDACKSLLQGESDIAIAGGICLIIGEYLHVSFSQAGVLADDGYTRVFDHAANGFALGEGCGLVMLKRLEDAEQDGDQIMAVISGSAVNNDGHTMGLTTPNQNAQKAVLEAAYLDAGIAPSSIGYLECHGTGTLLGDPIEIKAANQVFSNTSDKRRYCAIGSVKSNVGHTMTAAGIASLIKVILSIQHRQLVPSLHCQSVHPRFKLQQTAFFVNDSLKAWKPIDGICRAGVSSFGFGGTNAHLVVEEPVSIKQPLRVSKPATGFNCQRHWLGNESFDDLLPEFEKAQNYKVAGRGLAELLNELSEEKISVDEAMKMLEESL